MFNVGDKVCLVIDNSVVGVVISVIPSSEAVTRYQVFHDATKMAVYFENQLLPVADSHGSRKLSLQDFLGEYAAQKLRINSASTMFALNTGNIKFIPFQFRPLARILNAERPRFLIADEVGVGKTIETGIILKEFEKRDSVKSAIIICPKDLTSKWRREMKSRFDEAFEVLTSDRLSYCFDELEVPSLFGYGALDVVVPAGNRDSIINAFQNAGAEYDYVLYPVSGHGLKLNHITPAARKYSAKLFEYCEKYF